CGLSHFVLILLTSRRKFITMALLHCHNSFPVLVLRFLDQRGQRDITGTFTSWNGHLARRTAHRVISSLRRTATHRVVHCGVLRDGRRSRDSKCCSLSFVD